MTDEEKKAIEYFKEHINYFQEQIKFIETVDCDYYDEEYELYKNRVKQFNTVLNLIKKQQADLEKKDKIIEKLKNNNKDLLRKLRNRVKEVNKLTKYSLYKKEFATLNIQLQEKDKIIHLMAEWISDKCFYSDNCGNSCELIQDSCYKDTDCRECIIKYFEKLVFNKR